MNESDRQNIEDNIDVLTDLLDLNSNLLNQLINKNIFTQYMINDIMRVESESDRKKRFLMDLCRRGPEACDTFVEVLYGVDQMDVAKKLRPNSFKTALTQDEVIENITSSPAESASTLGFTNLGLNDGSGGDPSATDGLIEHNEYLSTVQKCKKPMIGKNIYPMNRNPRGFCIIFNFDKFVNYPQRLGSETETKRLNDVFSQLQFKVIVETNLTRERMQEKLHELSRNADLRDHDSLVIVILSHGQSGFVITSDGYGFQFESIIETFNNEKCPQLINKPKLFFFNCCRGDNHDSGPKHVFEGMEAAVSDAKPFTSTKVPLNGDIMICYSTIDGFVSWRNEGTGSWFGTALSQALMKYAHSFDLHQILTMASEFIDNKITENGEKQVMEHISRGWKKLFYFNPGYTCHSNDNSIH
ncbi:caspase-3-like [Oppia nitens]|uniref:caspase-3-like n=1 Tax=Oppia nitens TaxID=1686743 RepID=UPI0023DCB2C9|nr:caspase-3-like [Oppia nitens]